MAKILLVEDESELSRIIAEWLSDELYIVECTDNGLDAVRMMSNRAYDLIILDLMLPGLSGLDVCRQYRERAGDAPILMLTAKKTLASKEQGLDSGADDYLTKPFKLRELSARIRALLRRPRAVMPSLIRIGDITINTTERQVFLGGREVKLLSKEFTLLEVLVRSRGHVLSVDALIDALWNSESEISPDTIRSYIRSLRKKIDYDGKDSLIQNVHGLGYRID